jgi:hypothetical protein
MKRGEREYQNGLHSPGERGLAGAGRTMDEDDVT